MGSLRRNPCWPNFARRARGVGLGSDVHRSGEALLAWNPPQIYIQPAPRFFPEVLLTVAIQAMGIHSPPTWHAVLTTTLAPLLVVGFACLLQRAWQMPFAASAVGMWVAALLVLTLWPVGNLGLFRPGMRLGSSTAVVWLAYGFLCLVQARENRKGRGLLAYALALGGAAGVLVYSDPTAAVVCVVPAILGRILTLRRAWRVELPVWIAFLFGAISLFLVAKLLFEPLVALAGCAKIVKYQWPSVTSYIAKFGDLFINVSASSGRSAELLTIIGASVVSIFYLSRHWPRRHYRHGCTGPFLSRSLAFFRRFF